MFRPKYAHSLALRVRFASSMSGRGRWVCRLVLSTLYSYGDSIPMRMLSTLGHGPDQEWKICSNMGSSLGCGYIGAGRSMRFQGCLGAVRERV